MSQKQIKLAETVLRTLTELISTITPQVNQAILETFRQKLVETFLTEWI